MEMNRLFTGIYNLCKWITYFFLLNLLWVGGTLLGGIVLGFMPSTTAIFAIARKTAAWRRRHPIIKNVLECIPFIIFAFKWSRSHPHNYLSYLVCRFTVF
ncbi:DUF624 domain-containing protein [Alkalicoccobacillus plakortidis]|uniref:DUF624 domain-containing protein n=1 Tax=Alkalicoccobacillus plakortidis TaxID=444060 RepID=UPI00358DB8AB